MKNTLKKITAMILAMMMVFSVCACNPSNPPENQYPANGARKIVTVDKTVYASATSTETLSVAHYENESEILLIEVNTAVNTFLNEFLHSNVTIEEDDKSVLLTRDNGALCEIDFVEDTVCFSDFDSFSMGAQRSNPYDLLAFPYTNEEGESRYIRRESSFFTPGYGLIIDLAQRDIPLDIYDGKKYIPLQTFNDLFINPYGVNVAYNGKDIFVLVGNTISPDLEEIYYHEERTERSVALAEFNYNELCLYLDLYYGLQEEHGFNDGFDNYLEVMGLKDKLLALDSINTFNAIGALTLGNMADKHSSIVSPSPYFASTNISEEVDIKPANEYLEYVKASTLYPSIRAQKMGDVQFYQKVGNTAYITFDNFTVGDRSGDYSEESIQIDDTFSLIMLAHAQISQDEEIENVVVDLSCNGGGAVDACVYLCSWMLGSCDFSVYNSITEGRAITSYSADINLDGKFDADDTISDKNLYCLISPVSFSCGNYAPAILKASGKVTMVGKTSGGGVCTVRHAITADGTAFSMSDPCQMSIVKNGTYYGVDGGVEPDLYLSKVENFYNRDTLTAYINAML